MTPGLPQPQLVNGKAQQQSAAIEKIFDLGVGRYDVTVTVGPSYQSKRQEAVASMLEFMRVNPVAAPLIADLVASNSDWNGAKEIAKRLKAFLAQAHPGLIDDDDNSAEAQVQQLTAQHAKMEQELQLCSQELQKAQQEIATKQTEQQGRFAIEKMKTDANSQLQIALAEIKAQATVTAAEITSKMQSAKIRADFEMKQLEMSQDLSEMLHEGAHDSAMSAQEHAQNLEAADQGHQQTLEQGEQSADQQSKLADQNAQNQAAVQAAAAPDTSQE